MEPLLGFFSDEDGEVEVRDGQELRVSGTGTRTGANRRFRNWNLSDRFRFHFQKFGICYPPGTWYILYKYFIFIIYKLIKY